MDRKELTSVYDEHSTALYQFFLVLTQNENDAKDLLQELLIRLARLSKSLEAGGDGRNYLFRMARNLTIDRVRQKRARDSRDERWQAQQSSLVPVEDQDEQLFQSQLQEALSSLPSKQRTVVFLSLWQEWSFEEIAAVEGISRNTAASHYRYALDKLQTAVRPLYNEIQ
jgi:RNA polymerase sigma-70 factor (ECF subfamily)